jgi:hypothetical protein
MHPRSRRRLDRALGGRHPRRRYLEGGPITGFQSVLNNRDYDVLPHGNLLMVLPATQQEVSAPAPILITTALKWTEELKARVPTKTH